MDNHSHSGFTLFELLITLAIVGILASLAYPSYLNHITKVRRTNRQAALMELAGRMEQYYLQNNTYQGATLPRLGTTSSTPEGYYALTLQNLSAATYTLH